MKTTNSSFQLPAKEVALICRKAIQNIKKSRQDEDERLIQERISQQKRNDKMWLNRFVMFVFRQKPLSEQEHRERAIEFLHYSGPLGTSRLSDRSPWLKAGKWEDLANTMIKAANLSPNGMITISLEDMPMLNWGRD